jgi:hypothetical protein
LLSIRGRGPDGCVGPARVSVFTRMPRPVHTTGVVPAVDLIHHHGQINYLQMLLGDRDDHFDMDACARWYGPPEGAARPG